MPADLTEALHEAADGPLSPLDHTELRRRASRRTVATRTAYVGAAAAIVGVAVAGVVALQGTQPPTPEVVAEGTPTPTTESSPAPVRLRPTSQAVASSFTASGCELLDAEVLESREHFDGVGAPPADTVYTAGRPTASGPHHAIPAPIANGVAATQLDERATTHNLEHGAVIIWFDPAQLDQAAINEIGEVTATLNEAGFAANQARAGVIASPYVDPGIDSGGAVALRAWGEAIDCAAWHVDYLYGFVAEAFGSRGSAPEGELADYPDGVLEIVDAASS